VTSINDLQAILDRFEPVRVSDEGAIVLNTA
jgi:hypothetical protein